MRDLFSRRALTAQDAAFWRVYQRESYGLLMWGCVFASAACSFFWVFGSLVDHQPLLGGTQNWRAGVAGLYGLGAVWCWANRNREPSQRQRTAMMNFFCLGGIELVQLLAYKNRSAFPITDVIWGLQVTTITATVVVFGLMKLPARNTLTLTLIGMATAVAYVLKLEGASGSQLLRFCGHLALINIIGFVVRLSAERKERALFLSEEANASKTRFVASMSHDLRTPLHGILQLLSVTKDQTTGRVRERLGMVEAGAAELLSTINRILDYSAVSSGKVRSQEACVDLLDVCEKVRILHSPLAVAKGVELRLVCAVAEQFVLADGDKIIEVLNNLVGNAVKYTEEGWVNVEIKSKSSLLPGKVIVDLVVRDTGIGIGEEDMRFIGTPFWQGLGGRSPKGGGTGLGLALVMEHVRQTFDGTIKFRSTEWVGTRVAVNFVVKKADSPIATADSRSSDQLNGEDFSSSKGETRRPEEQLSACVDAIAAIDSHGVESSSFHTPEGVRILLVEDNQLNAIGATDYLTREGFAIEVARDGAEACELYAQNDYDVILMDLQMPVVDGFEATRRIRTMEREEMERKRTPILAWTATHGADVRQACLIAGMDGMATKGIGQDLPKQIRDVIGKSRSVSHKLDVSYMAQ